MNGKVRPTSVTVVAVILLALNAMGILMTVVMSGSPKMIEVCEKMGTTVGAAIATTVVSGGIAVAAAIGMLKGMNWGRWLYIVYFPIAAVIGIVRFGFSLMSVPPIIVYVVFVVLLTRKNATDYFAGAASPPPLPSA